MGVCVREGEGVATLLEAGYFMQVAKEHCRMHVSFRVDTCSSAGGSTFWRHACEQTWCDCVAVPDVSCRRAAGVVRCVVLLRHVPAGD